MFPDELFMIGHDHAVQRVVFRWRLELLAPMLAQFVSGRKPTLVLSGVLMSG